MPYTTAPGERVLTQVSSGDGTAGDIKFQPMFPLLVGILQLLSQAFTYLEDPDFKTKPPALKIALSATVLFGCTQWIESIRLYSKLKRERREHQTQFALVAALAVVVGVAKVSAEDLSLNAYRVEKPWRLMAQWALRALAHRVVSRIKAPPPEWHRGLQRRVGRINMGVDSPQSGTVWTWGKGVVGAVWAGGLVSETFSRLIYASEVDATEAQWNRRSADTRMGLTFKEWEATKRYATIIAVPISSEGKYLGALTIDTHDEKVAGKIGSKAVEKSLLAAASMLVAAFETPGKSESKN